MKKAMMFAVVTLVAVTVLALSTTLLAADVFTHPPESSTAPGEWVTSYPYPRNATIDFATDPNTWPEDPTLFIGKDLIPGVTYETYGWDDAKLHNKTYPDILGMGSDGFGWNEWENDLIWYSDDPVGSGRTGVIEVVGGVALYFANSPRNVMPKHIWTEIIMRPAPGRTSSQHLQLVDGPLGGYGGGEQYLSSGSELLFSNDLGDGWISETWYLEISPSPAWEYIGWSQSPPYIFPDPPEVWYIDEIHIATEAVPEPGTVALFGLGLLGVAARLRRLPTARNRTRGP